MHTTARKSTYPVFNGDTDFLLSFILHFDRSNATGANPAQLVRTRQPQVVALQALIRQLEKNHELEFADTSVSFLYCHGLKFDHESASDKPVDCRVILALRLSEPSANNANMVMDKLQSLVRTNLKAVDFRGCEIAIRKTNRFRCPWKLANSLPCNTVLGE
jgi:hypothetical protein